MRREIQKIIDNSKEDQIDLATMNINDQEIHEVLLYIKIHRPNLRELFLAKNQLTDEATPIIAKELGSCASLSFIDLQFNNVSADGIARIYSAMSEHDHFELAVAGTQLTDAEEMLAIENEYKKSPGFK